MYNGYALLSVGVILPTKFNLKNKIMNILKRLFGTQNTPLQQCDVSGRSEQLNLQKPKEGEVKKPTVAERLHDSYCVQSEVEDVIMEAFEKYEPEIYEKLDFHISSDYYDNSIEIYFDVSLPYPYEPSKEVRQAIYDLGFSIVYWNFTKDVMDVPCNRVTPPPPNNIWKNSPDEIRGWEPRHNKYGIWIPNKYGYVDDRFNQKEWESKYNFRST